ncbi:hypothetical protein LSAT2_022996 [Lamellibrachia satsuma]|nr:hypothetical protein LSAT2_022996 [Lamellibrachia satsuma]
MLAEQCSTFSGQRTVISSTTQADVLGVQTWRENKKPQPTGWLADDEHGVSVVKTTSRLEPQVLIHHSCLVGFDSQQRGDHDEDPCYDRESTPSHPTFVPAPNSKHASFGSLLNQLRDRTTSPSSVVGRPGW